MAAARPKTGVTPVRNIRIGEELWRASQAAAAAHGETLTAVIEQALVAYVAKHKREQAKAED